MDDIQIIKVIIVGDSSVGQTSFLNQYCWGKFNNSTPPTVGMDFSSQVVNREGKIIKLQLWDVAGTEKSTTITKLFVRRTKGCIIMCDISNQNSLLSALDWKAIVLQNTENEHVPIFLAQNQLDLLNQDQTLREGKYADSSVLKAFGEENNFTQTYQVSAQTGENMDDLFENLINEIFQSKSILDNDDFFLSTISVGGAKLAKTPKINKKKDDGCC